MQHPQHAEALGAALAAKFRGFETRFRAGTGDGRDRAGAHGRQGAGMPRRSSPKQFGKQMLIRDAFQIRAGERFLAVEDVITTGGSLRKAIRAAEGEGGGLRRRGLYHRPFGGRRSRRRRF